MPNRIIKESICTSDKIASLTDFEFRLWVSLITQADDVGRGDARPAIIKGRAFPLRDRVTAKDIASAVHGLAAKGCISLYTVGGKPYFWFPTWSEHQRVRDVKPKFPGPEEADPIVCQSAADCRRLPPESESESNPESEVGCAEPQAPSAPPAICFPLNDGSEYQISHEQVAEWVSLYPGTDVMQQLRSMLAWLNANPTRRKTKKGVKSFVVSWLNREQNRGRGGQQYSYKNQNLTPSCAGSSDDRIKEDMERMSRLMAKMHEQEGK